jgi:outer membrane protein
MKTSLFQLNARAMLCAVACGVIPFAASAQTYTFKIGAGRIDPRATSSDLEGTLPMGLAAPSTVPLSAGNQLEVQPKSTLLFSIERAFNDHWSAELVLGAPPTHDVKLRASDEVMRGAALATSLAGSLPADYFTTTNASTASTYAGLFPAQYGGVAGYYKARAALKVAPYDGVVVARVKQAAPTLFLNYKFLDASSAFRPYVGVGVNYTNFKVTSTQAGNDLYNDGPVRISSTDSIGFAFQVGGTYKFDKNWSASAGWTTAAVKNNVTIRTDHSQQNLSYRFHPSVFSLMVGYSY